MSVVYSNIRRFQLLKFASQHDPITKIAMSSCNNQEEYASFGPTAEVEYILFYDWYGFINMIKVPEFPGWSVKF